MGLSYLAWSHFMKIMNIKLENIKLKQTSYISYMMSVANDILCFFNFEVGETKVNFIL